ncbi:DUF167 domain-containing protein [Fibrisoma montanum]|uniref:UPF0235 protein DYU11_15995 n=1 Tax=Fibrisoma montanum TaxID=2305895 RepID=A0A418M8U1_9BACT|nr:DUF167 domain-containing protein [Fibrisoma montanum]RIV22515.1 DUF167 domain-containing protein [Fibrisoma montanum]
MIVHLTVKPGSKVDQLFYNDAGLLVVKLKAPAQDGKANAYLVEFLAKQLGLAKSKVQLVAGFTNPHKRLSIDADDESVRLKLKTLAG